jgi:hypothetical protein
MGSCGVQCKARRKQRYVPRVPWLSFASVTRVLNSPCRCAAGAAGSPNKQVRTKTPATNRCAGARGQEASEDQIDGRWAQGHTGWQGPQEGVGGCSHHLIVPRRAGLPLWGDVGPEFCWVWVPDLLAAIGQAVEECDVSCPHDLPLTRKLERGQGLRRKQVAARGAFRRSTEGDFACIES